MRLEAKIKMGYYPTPIPVVDRIRTFLRYPQENVNILDHCCGEGLALKNLTDGFNAKTYGVELDEYRAEQAKENLTHVLKCSYEDARISNNAFSGLFLNPPYDWDTPSEYSENTCERFTFYAGFFEGIGKRRFFICGTFCDRFFCLTAQQECRSCGCYTNVRSYNDKFKLVYLRFTILDLRFFKVFYSSIVNSTS